MYIFKKKKGLHTIAITMKHVLINILHLVFVYVRFFWNLYFTSMYVIFFSFFSSKCVVHGFAIVMKHWGYLYILMVIHNIFNSCCMLLGLYCTLRYDMLICIVHQVRDKMYALRYAMKMYALRYTVYANDFLVNTAVTQPLWVINVK